jgi:hypothetical protein
VRRWSEKEGNLNKITVFIFVIALLLLVFPISLGRHGWSPER